MTAGVELPLFVFSASPSVSSRHLFHHWWWLVVHRKDQGHVHLRIFPSPQDRITLVHHWDSVLWGFDEKFEISLETFSLEKKLHNINKRLILVLGIGFVTPLSSPYIYFIYNSLFIYLSQVAFWLVALCIVTCCFHWHYLMFPVIVINVIINEGQRYEIFWYFEAYWNFLSIQNFHAVV